MIRFIVATAAALLCAAMIRDKKRGGLLEWLIILIGCGCSVSLVMEVLEVLIWS